MSQANAVDFAMLGFYDAWAEADRTESLYRVWDEALAEKKQEQFYKDWAEAEKNNEQLYVDWHEAEELVKKRKEKEVKEEPKKKKKAANKMQ